MPVYSRNFSAKFKNNKEFKKELDYYLREYAGRPTPLYFAQNLTEKIGGAKIYLKREDLLHGGAHKINNTLGQALLAKKMKKKRIIAETGAGQHGVDAGLRPGAAPAFPLPPRRVRATSPASASCRQTLASGNSLQAACLATAVEPPATHTLNR